MDILAGALSELHPSVHQVLSDEDLLTEILLRLPVLSLLQFKIVSKTWLALIKSPNFTFRRNQNPKLDPPSGIFLMHGPEVAYSFLKLDTLNNSPLDFHFPFQPDKPDSYNLRIMNSCNGLLLCFFMPFNLFVYNPSTNQFKLLPEHHYSKLAKHMFKGVKIAFDPTKSCHYKVIYAGYVYNVDANYSVQFSTYSSETGCWSLYGDRFPALCFINFRDGIYWNGAIHWLRRLGHYKLDVDDLVLTTISKPATLDANLHVDCEHKLFVSRGCLFLVCVVAMFCARDPQLNVYEMRNGCSKWSVKYVINVDDFWMLIPGAYKIFANHIYVK